MNYKRPGFFQKIRDFLTKELRWLSPGLGVKRWVFLVLAGISLLAIGFAILVLDIYRNAPDSWWLPVLSTISLRFLPRLLRAIIFGGIGVSLIVWGMWGLNRALLAPFLKPGKHVLDSVTQYRRKEKGPRIVVLGGGTGLASLLRGLKKHTNNITAIVTVADDGGSSGELRKSTGILPPGDIRNCLAALSNDEDLISKIFQYRFAAVSGLNGHSLGNLLITALTEITGSFEDAVAESGRVLAIQGTVLPATLHNVQLIAEISKKESGEIIKIKGESEIPKIKGNVQRIWLEPSNPLAYPPAIQAILSADLVLIGPGSLYTSILPNLLVKDIANALKSSKSLKFFICNVATQPGETDGYKGIDHLLTIEKHLGENLFDLILCNNNNDPDLPENLDWVTPEDSLESNYAVYNSDLVNEENPWRHDSEKLSSVIMDLFLERTGPLIEREND